MTPDEAENLAEEFELLEDRVGLIWGVVPSFHPTVREYLEEIEQNMHRLAAEYRKIGETLRQERSA